MEENGPPTSQPANAEKRTTLGRKIRELRLTKHWTQEQLATRLGKTRVYITRLENDDYRSPGSDVVGRLAVLFGISETSLYEALGTRPERDKSNAALDDYILYLQGKNPSPSVLVQLRKITEALLPDEE